MNLIKCNWWTSLLMFCAGVLLCFLYDRADVLTVIIYVVGIVYTVAGCVNVIICSQTHTNGKSSAITTVVGWIIGLGCIGLGAAMLITPEHFERFLVYVFGALLILGGVFHIIVLACYYTDNRMPLWLYLPPLVLIGGGLVILCSRTVIESTPAVILITGIGGIIYSLETLAEYIVDRALEKRKRAREEADKARDQEERPRLQSTDGDTGATDAATADGDDVIHFTH